MTRIEAILTFMAMNELSFKYSTLISNKISEESKYDSLSKSLLALGVSNEEIENACEVFENKFNSFLKKLEK